MRLGASDKASNKKRRVIFIRITLHGIIRVRREFTFSYKLGYKHDGAWSS